MSNAIRDLVLKTLKKDDQKQDSIEVTKGQTLGIDNANDSAVAGRPGFIWVREFSQQGAVFQAFNQSIKTLVGLPVLLTKERVPPYRRVVIGIDWDVLPATSYAGEAYELINHAFTHEWQDTAPGVDAVTIYPRALAAFRVYPIVGVAVGVAQGYYNYNEVLTYFPGLASLDLISEVPAVGNVVGLVVYLDFTDNSIHYLAGAEIGSIFEPVYPAVPTHAFGLCYIKLTAAMTQLTEVNIKADIRTAFIFPLSVPGYVLSEVAHLAEELDLEISRHVVEGL